MKKILVAAILCVLLVTGCNIKKPDRYEDESKNDSSMFVIIEETLHYQILYNKKTKVMYAMSCSYYNYGNFTVLVNSDGTPMLWDE